MTDEEATLILVAGPNGTGKSSLIRKLVSDGWIQRVVNPDALQSALGPATAARVEAGREALMLVDSWIQQKASFVWETTLASASQTSSLASAERRLPVIASACTLSGLVHRKSLLSVFRAGSSRAVILSRTGTFSGAIRAVPATFSMFIGSLQTNGMFGITTRTSPG